MTDGGWPADWNERKRGANCPVCADLGHDDEDDHAVFVAELDSSEVRVPHYHDDPAAGGPITWVDMFTGEPMSPEILRRQAENLRRLLTPPR